MGSDVNGSKVDISDAVVKSDVLKQPAMLRGRFLITGGFVT